MLLAGALYRCYLIHFSRYREGSETSLHMVGITPMIISENCLEAVIYDNGDSAGSARRYRVNPEIESPGRSAAEALIGNNLKRINAFDPTVFSLKESVGASSAERKLKRFFVFYHLFFLLQGYLFGWKTRMLRVYIKSRWIFTAQHGRKICLVTASFIVCQSGLGWHVRLRITSSLRSCCLLWDLALSNQ